MEVSSQAPEFKFIDSIELKNSITYLGENNILKQSIKKNASENLESAKENIRICRELLKNQKGLLIVDITLCKEVSIEARMYYSSKEVCNSFYAIALIVNSPISRVIANFMMGINKIAVPTKVFNNEADAYKWLNKHA